MHNFYSLIIFQKFKDFVLKTVFINDGKNIQTSRLNSVSKKYLILYSSKSSELRCLGYFCHISDLDFFFIIASFFCFFLCRKFNFCAVVNVSGHHAVGHAFESRSEPLFLLKYLLIGGGRLSLHVQTVLTSLMSKLVKIF